MSLTRYQKATLRRAANILESLVRDTDVISSPQAARDLLKCRIGALEHEVFIVVWLNNRHQIIEIVELFRGTIDSAAVYPREVVKSALNHNAAAAIFSHNHPSYRAEPSDTDIRLTRRLADALALIDIRVIDHIVVAGPNCVSFAEQGLL